MNRTPDAVQLFSERSESYVRFVRLVAYPEGVRAFFLASALLRSDLASSMRGAGPGSSRSHCAKR